MNKLNENATCVLCEADGKENKAEYFAKFNEDLIPVCRKHNKLLKEDNLLSILDEESS